jgi:hypothetical protein
MNSEILVELVLAYVVVHLGLYIFVLRHRAEFGQEATIFGYHFCSAILVSVVSLGSWIVFPNTVQVAAAIAAICIHGIYSTSFLELWSLSEGGYSLSILRLVNKARAEGRALDRGALVALGETKKGNRVEGLVKLRLAHQSTDLLVLTAFGRLTAAVFAGVASATVQRDVG